jgi:hypothetical protein
VIQAEVDRRYVEAYTTHPPSERDPWLHAQARRLIAEEPW